MTHPTRCHDPNAHTPRQWRRIFYRLAEPIRNELTDRLITETELCARLTHPRTPGGLKRVSPEDIHQTLWFWRYTTDARGYLVASTEAHEKAAGHKADGLPEVPV